MTDDRPCDTELPCDVREAFANMVETRNRFYGGKVIELAPYRNVQQQLRHDLANAFRSADAGKYDPIDGDV